ncbi:hypothetical protein D8674_008393 [Pyrus ussuriensis x Pyrus communis]|uniref:Uncharacterized protein n=1 Tax=Pyrus ussuriensis x Pyrus communis TaxID=2448454 RepID=A0A5N5I5J0_9ROSA|nr:hypothetical protein D8674_008393 [Pyrus ussuriensis x Pyrus communis]
MIAVSGEKRIRNLDKNKRILSIILKDQKKFEEQQLKDFFFIALKLTFAAMGSRRTTMPSPAAQGAISGTGYIFEVWVDMFPALL